MAEVAALNQAREQRYGPGRRKPLSEPVSTDIPEIENFIARTGRQSHTAPLKERLKVGAKELFVPLHELKGEDVVATRGNEKLTRTRVFAPLIDAIQQHHVASRNWAQKASESVEGMFAELYGPNEVEFFRRYLPLKGLQEEHARHGARLAEMVQQFEAEPTASFLESIRSFRDKQYYPPGLTKDIVDKGLAKLEAQLKTNPNLQRAHQSIRKVLDSFRAELQDREILGADAREHYYPHQIIDRLFVDALEGAVQRARAPKRGRAGFEKTRTGSARDFSTDVITTLAKYIAEAGETIQKRDITFEMAEHYDLRRNPLDRAKSWTPGEEIPEGYDRWNISNAFSRMVARSIEERLHIDSKTALSKALAKEYGLREDQVLSLMDLVGRSKGVGEKEYILPVEVIKALNKLSEPSPGLNPFQKATRVFNEQFKSFVIHKLPIQQNLRNFTGDAMKAAIQFGAEFFDPSLWRAALDDVKAVYLGKIPSDTYITSQKFAVPSSGRIAVEAKDLDQLEAFHRFFQVSGTEKTKTQVLKFLRATGPKFASAREDLVRQVIYRLNLKRHAAGQRMLLGIADPERVKGLVDYEGGAPEAAAAYIAKTSLIDYSGDFTPTEDGWRRGLAPFYSWMKGNTFLFPYRMTRAFAREGLKSESNQVMAKNLGAVLSVLAAIRVWNSYVMGDAEDKLPEQFRTGNHIILGSPGKPWVKVDDRGRERPMVVAIPDPIDDILQFYGFDGVSADVMTALKGNMSWGELLDRYVERAPKAIPRGIAGQMGPWLNVPAAVGGKKTYPDPMNWRDIPEEDRWPEALKALGAGGLPMLEAKQGANVLDPIAQGGLRKPTPSQFPYYQQDLMRKRFSLESEIKDLEGRLAGFMSGVRGPEMMQPDRIKKRDQLLRLRDAKVAEIRRIGERLAALERKAAVDSRP